MSSTLQSFWLQQSEFLNVPSANKSAKLLGNVISHKTQNNTGIKCQGKMTSNCLKEGKQDHHCDTHSNGKGTLRTFDQVFILVDLNCKRSVRPLLIKPHTQLFNHISDFFKTKNIRKFATQPSGS